MADSSKSIQGFILVLIALILIHLSISAGAQNQPAIDPILSKAIRLFQEGNYLDAYIELEAVLKIDPHHSQALQYKAQCEMNLGGGTASEPTPVSSPEPAHLETPPPIQDQPTPELNIETTTIPEPSPTSNPSSQSSPAAPSDAPPLVTPSPIPAGNQQFIITDPPGWVKQLTNDPSQVAYYQLPNQQRIVIAEYIIFQEPLGTPITPEEYLKQVQETRLKPPEFQLYVPVKTESTTIAGLPAVQHEFLFSNGIMQLKARATMIILDHQAFSFLFYSNIVDFDRLQSDFSQILNLVTVQEKSGLPPSSDLIFQALPGRVSIPLPQGSVMKSTLPAGATYSGPNQSEIIIRVFESEDELKKAENQYISGKTYEKQSSLSVGQQIIYIKLYQSFENNTNYALLSALYAGQTVLLVISLPQDQYQSAQSWLTQFFKAAQFH